MGQSDNGKYNNQTLMYVAGGAAAGYFLGPQLFPAGTSPVMGALYGAAAGYGVHMLMKPKHPKQ